VGDIYQCYVDSDPNIITEESAQIKGVSGEHRRDKNNNDVVGFRAGYQTIQVFPKGLDKIFGNIKFILIWFCELREIHQSDLKVFPKLVYFSSNSNGIEVIEAGLFDFNLNLEVVSFQEKKLIHIDPNVFDHLTKLSNFWFKAVPCVYENVFDSKAKVEEVLKVVKSDCTNSEFLSLENQIKNLEIESKSLSFEALSTKLVSFEKSFNNSIFYKSRTLNYKLKSLKSAVNSN